MKTSIWKNKYDNKKGGGETRERRVNLQIIENYIKFKTRRVYNEV